MTRKTAIIAAVSVAIIVTTTIFVLSAPKNSGQSSGVNPNNACSLQLIQSIPMPRTAGRIDHMNIDLPGQRLFVAALGNNSGG
jgi:hypothetical protein